MDTGRRSPLRREERKSGHPGHLRAILFVILLLCTAAVGNLCALQGSHPTQDDVEAAYLYDFGQFIRWPSNARRKTLNICVLGQDPFGATLDNIVANEVIDGHPLEVVRVADVSDARSCAILFISRSEASQIEKDLSLLNGLPVMTVSDMPEFLERGGMIQFVLMEDRVRFEVNLDAAEKCDLQISSQLLKVAVKVIGNGHREAGR